MAEGSERTCLTTFACGCHPLDGLAFDEHAGRSDLTAADELRARDEGWLRCIQARDVQGVLDYLDEDYALVLVQPVRSVARRDEWLMTLPDYPVHEWSVEEQLWMWTATLA